MKISEDIIEKIKVENDIVDVISADVKLKRSGNNYFGLCPFHKEKTPSFSVSSEKQIYKCFGCGESGNVITYTMKTRNLDFIETVKFLADRVNIFIDTQDKNEKSKSQNRIYEINVEAAKYFFNNLFYNQKAFSYFINRSITEKTVKSFGLGYSKNEWRGLLNYLKNKGYSEYEIIHSGLCIKKDNNIYDRFRNRVMFPVFDYKGKVIGFGGRVLDDSKPKYLNSPETAIFKKGTNLYGLNFLLKNYKGRTIIIVEGYMDMISLYQHGIVNVVASLGTALTIQQAKLLKRYADNIVVSYDADLAGQKATLRGLDILKEQGFKIKVLTVPSGKDPDEYIRVNGKDKFMELVKNSLSLIEYKLKKEREGLDLSNSNEIVTYIKRISEIIYNLNSVEKDIYIKKISEDTNINQQAIYDMLEGNIEKNVKNQKEMNIYGNIGQKLFIEPAYLKAERNILKLMIDDDIAFKYIVAKNIDELFVLPSHKKIYRLIIKNVKKDNFLFVIESQCTDVESSREWVSILNNKVIYDNMQEKLIDDYIQKIEKYKLEESKRKIMKQLNQSLMENNMDKASNLSKELEMIREKITSMNEKEVKNGK